MCGGPGVAWWLNTRVLCLLSVDDLALCLYPPLDAGGVETSVSHASGLCLNLSSCCFSGTVSP